MDMIGPAEHAFKLAVVIKEASPFMIDKLRREFSKLFGAVELVAKSTKSFKDAVVNLGKVGLTGLVVAIGSAAKIMIFMDDQIAIMGQRFGMTRQQISEFNKEIYKTSAAAGIVADQIVHMSHELIEAGFKGKTADLLKLATTTFKFAEATGVSSKSAATFAGELSQLGINSINLMQHFANLRRSLQLSTDQFELVIKVAKEAREAIYGLGTGIASTQEYGDQFAKSMADVAGVLQQLGLSSQSTSKIIDSLMDPTTFRENSKLMVLLGQNWQDTIGVFEGTSGHLLSAKDTVDALSLSAQRLSQLSPALLSQMAKDIGIPARDLKALQKGMAGLTPQQKEMMAQNIELDRIWGEMGQTITPLMRAWRAFFATFIVSIKPVIDIFSGFLTKIGTGFKFITDKLKSLEENNTLLGKGLKLVFAGAIIAAVILFVVELGKMYTNMVKNKGMAGSLATEMGKLALATTAAATAYKGLGTAMGGAQVGQLAQGFEKGTILDKLGKPITSGPIVETTAGASVLTLTSFVKNLGTTLTNVAKSPMGKILGWAGLGITAIGALGARKFTTGDLGGMLMSAGFLMLPFPGLNALGLIMIGVGGLLQAVGIFKTWDLFHWGTGGMKLGGPSEAEAAEVTQVRGQNQFSPEVTRAIKERSKEIDFLTHAQNFTDQQIVDHLKAIRTGVTDTAKGVNEQTSTHKKTAREQMDQTTRDRVFNNSGSDRDKNAKGRP